MSPSFFIKKLMKYKVFAGWILVKVRVDFG